MNIFKYKKIKHIERIIEGCKTYTQWSSCYKWLNNLYNNDIISLKQMDDLLLKILYQLYYIRDLEDYQRRLNSV